MGIPETEIVHARWAYLRLRGQVFYLGVCFVEIRYVSPELKRAFELAANSLTGVVERVRHGLQIPSQ